GRQRIPVAELHRLPGDDPHLDTVLEHGDLITAVELPAPVPSQRSTYRKIRDRASYAFALVSVAAVLELDSSGPGPSIRAARLAPPGRPPRPGRSGPRPLARPPRRAGADRRPGHPRGVPAGRGR